MGEGLVIVKGLEQRFPKPGRKRGTKDRYQHGNPEGRRKGWRNFTLTRRSCNAEFGQGGKINLLYKESYGRVLNVEWLHWIHDMKYRCLRSLEMGKAYSCCLGSP